MRGGAFLNGKEGRVGFRKKPSLMVKKDGMILEQYLYDQKAYCLKEQYDGTECSDSMVPISPLHLISTTFCHYPRTSQRELPQSST